jgi:hypothetical protein
VENHNPHIIVKDLQHPHVQYHHEHLHFCTHHQRTCLFGIFHQQILHPNLAVPEPEQDCDTGSQNWIMNCDRQYRNSYPCFALLDTGLTLQLTSANPQSSHPERYDHDAEFSRSKPTHDDH